MFRRKPPEPREAQPEELSPAIDPQVFDFLDHMEKAGVQVLIRMGPREVYTTSVVGLGRDAFYIDTLSPPEGDRHVAPGSVIECEMLMAGITHVFRTAVLGRVEFVDELPAFKLSYPQEIETFRRRRSPRVQALGAASISFREPFGCDALVSDISEGGLAFEYAAELGRLRRGTVLDDVLLEMGSSPVIRIEAEVVGVLVTELGGLSLPSRYRASLRFIGLGAQEQRRIAAFMEEARLRAPSV
jgi:c-di-GMP-binding flagellar brake protein YcgR